MVLKFVHTLNDLWLFGKKDVKPQEEESGNCYWAINVRLQVDWSESCIQEDSRVESRVHLRVDSRVDFREDLRVDKLAE